jgi:thiol:disulfide interchange protein
LRFPGAGDEGAGGRQARRGTRQDPEITAFRRAAGRDGVPLYAYYPPRGEPTVLPQILTPALVLANLQSPQS